MRGEPGDERTDGARPGGAAAPAELLAGLLRSVADGVYAVDRRGRVRLVNPAALAILGYDEERELLGAPSHATIHARRPDGSPYPERDCPLLLPRTTGAPVRVEDDWFVRRDGSMVPVAYSSAPVAEPGGRGAVVVFHETTARREADETARRAVAEQARAEELQASRARIVSAADAERRRLGRDIHDGAQQRLLTVALGIQGALGALPADPAAAGERLRDALADTRAAIAELRELAAGIHPSTLTSHGLRGAVESLTARMPVPTAFDVPARRFPAELEAAAYFVVAEALANVAKHAGARRAEVVVAVVAAGEGGAEELRATVADDGRGGAAAAPGHGLQGLADRVAASGGRLAVDSPPGGGTAVTATLPLARS